MHSIRFLKPLALLATAILSGCHPRPLPPEPLPAPQLVLWDRAWSYHANPGQEIRTPHYHIFTTHRDPVFMDRLPLFMESAFSRYQQLVKPTKKPSQPMDVYLFGQRDQWDQFTDEITGPSAVVYHKIQEGGYVDNGRAVFYDIQRMKTFAVTGHEGFHQYIYHYAIHRPPSWLDESLACYFEGFYWQDNNLVFEPHRNHLRIAALRAALAAKATMELKDILATHPGQVIGGPSIRVAGYYAQLWAMSLFLQEHPNYKARFAKLLADLGSQRMIEQAAAAGFTGRAADYGPAIFRAYISNDLADVDKDFRAYCMKLAGF